MSKYDISSNTTMIFIDWDDTLFPTKWIVMNNINMNKPESIVHNEIYFKELDRLLYTSLKTISKYGKIYIVTNALLSWIRTTSLALPNTYNLLKQFTIISAREYKGKISKSPMDWKILTFRDIFKYEKERSNINNVISIGDAEFEYKASISLYDNDNSIYLKTIKFVKNPSYEVLIDQLKVLQNAVTSVWNKKSHKDLVYKKIKK